jgi:hypothetical protein
MGNNMIFRLIISSIISIIIIENNLTAGHKIAIVYENKMEREFHNCQYKDEDIRRKNCVKYPDDN